MVEYAYVIQRADGKYLRRMFYNKYGTKVFSFTNKQTASKQFVNYDDANKTIQETENCIITKIEKPFYAVGFLKTKHNGRKDILYPIWECIKQRCRNPKNNSYKNYGGRGIDICQEWFDSYELFKNWSMNNGYEKGLTIDRTNNDGNYCPENCRWVDRKIQQSNRRNTIILTYNGKTQTLPEWSKELKINRQTLYFRLKKLGFSVERAFTEKVSLNRYKRQIEVVEE